MILTPVPLPDLPTVLDAFDDALADAPTAQAAFRRIAATLALVRDGNLELSQDPDHHAQAVEFARGFGMVILDEAPTAGYTWDGHALRVRMEPSVIVHDVAHLQVCAPERRTAPDFGLGAGPETGLRTEADAAMSVFGVERELEESLASLLGILWEAELEQPAICAFLEQNWLEGGASAHNRRHFVKIVDHLAAHGFLTADGRPTRALRETPDAQFLATLAAA